MIAIIALIGISMVLLMLTFIFAILIYTQTPSAPTEAPKSKEIMIISTGPAAEALGIENEVAVAESDYNQTLVYDTDTNTYTLVCAFKDWYAGPSWNAPVGTKLYGHRTQVRALEKLGLIQYGLVNEYDIGYEAGFPTYTTRVEGGWIVPGFTYEELQAKFKKALVFNGSQVTMGLNTYFQVKVWDQQFTTGFTNQSFFPQQPNQSYYYLPMPFVGNNDGVNKTAPLTASVNGEVRFYKKQGATVDTWIQPMSQVLNVLINSQGFVEVHGFDSTLMQKLVDNGYVAFNNTYYYVPRDAWTIFMD